MRLNPNYRRVIPRDLFNEANLLKWIGHLALAFDGNEEWGGPTVEFYYPEDGFVVVQDGASGNIHLDNVRIRRNDGRMYTPYSTLNSREKWGLYVDTPGDEVISVYTEDGELTDDFKALVGAVKSH